MAARVGPGVPRDLEQEIYARVAARMLGSAVGGPIALAVAIILIAAAHAPSDMIALD